MALVVCLLVATNMVVMASAMDWSAREVNTVERATQTKDLLSSLATSHLSKGTYLIFGTGRRSERDLPVCDNPLEACNLVHKRYWLKPITERFCRCEDRSECPLYFTNLSDSNAQHVSNRAQLQFCGGTLNDIKECVHNEPALEVRRVERKKDPFSMSKSAVEGYDTRSRLLCRCHWPHRWILQETQTPSPAEMIFLYTCQKLPECRRYEVCGSIRADTLESYYTCSCPVGHLCVFPGHPATTHTQSNLHFYGEAYTASCLPK
ncbi:unnamed protein product [Meganyctiphanes norvegica]|uniref:Uncharacterized protein n=1 Tax=Meganyctiphanes norvegica TaxID=48144 RepID=A0AAV2QXF2_MEGNR